MADIKSDDAVEPPAKPARKPRAKKVPPPKKRPVLRVAPEVKVTVKEILAEVPKHPGVATSLRVVEIGGHEFLDIRDVISAPGEVLLGRGYLFPLDTSVDRSEHLATLGETLLALGEKLWPR